MKIVNPFGSQKSVELAEGTSCSVTEALTKANTGEIYDEPGRSAFSVIEERYGGLDNVQLQRNGETVRPEDHVQNGDVLRVITQKVEGGI